jgi:hypothetical protein
VDQLCLHARPKVIEQDCEGLAVAPLRDRDQKIVQLGSSRHRAFFAPVGGWSVCTQERLTKLFQRLSDTVIGWRPAVLVVTFCRPVIFPPAFGEPLRARLLVAEFVPYSPEMG